MLTWDAGRCASCGSPCNPSYRLCTTCDPAGLPKEPAVVEGGSGEFYVSVAPRTSLSADPCLRLLRSGRVVGD
jgi:hypothetical protein